MVHRVVNGVICFLKSCQGELMCVKAKRGIIGHKEVLNEDFHPGYFRFSLSFCCDRKMLGLWNGFDDLREVWVSEGIG